MSATHELGRMDADRFAEVREQAGYASVTLDADELLWLLDEVERLIAERDRETELRRQAELRRDSLRESHSHCPYPDEIADLLDERDAAVARVEAAEAKVQRVRAELADWDAAPRGELAPVYGLAAFIRRALDGDHPASVAGEGGGGE